MLRESLTQRWLDGKILPRKLQQCKGTWQGTVLTAEMLRGGDAGGETLAGLGKVRDT